MALPQGTRPLTGPLASREDAIQGRRLLIVPGNEIGRRSLLSLLVSTATVPEAGDSRKALLQDYLRRSKENKARNDKERLDDYYKRNYKDYFELFGGSANGKKEELLSETERGILEWLRKNK